MMRLHIAGLGGQVIGLDALLLVKQCHHSVRHSRFVIVPLRYLKRWMQFHMECNQAPINLEAFPVEGLGEKKKVVECFFCYL